MRSLVVLVLAAQYCLMYANSTSHCRRKLRGDDGVWRPMVARHVLGHQVDLFINGDRSRQRIAEGRSVRALELAAKAAYPALQWNKRKGKDVTLLCNWTPLVRVRCPTEEQSGANTVFAVCASGAQRLPQVDIPALVQAFRLAPAVIVAPLDYTGLLWATLFGWLIWRESPDAIMIFGAAIIVASGVITIRREQGQAGS